MTPIQLLVRSKNLLEDPKISLSKCCLARDERGESTHYLSEDAAAFCINGAVMRATGGNTEHWDSLRLALTALRNRVRTNFPGIVSPSYGDHVNYNNHPSTTKEDVINLIDLTIADLESAIS